MQRFTGLVCRPRVVVNAQAGLDFATIGEVDATDCRVMANLMVQIGQFSLIMFKSAHGRSITQRNLHVPAVPARTH